MLLSSVAFLFLLLLQTFPPCAVRRLQTDSARWKIFWREEGCGAGGHRGTNHWLQPSPSHPSPPFHPPRWFHADSLVVTRHCTQPLLIFDEGSGPSVAAFWAFNGTVFQWHSCAVTFQALLKNDLRSKSFYSLSVSLLCLQCSLNSRVSINLESSKSNYTCTVQTRWGDYLK